MIPRAAGTSHPAPEAGKAPPSAYLALPGAKKARSGRRWPGGASARSPNLILSSPQDWLKVNFFSWDVCAFLSRYYSEETPAPCIGFVGTTKETKDSYPANSSRSAHQSGGARRERWWEVRQATRVRRKRVTQPYESSPSAKMGSVSDTIMPLSTWVSNRAPRS